MDKPMCYAYAIASAMRKLQQRQGDQKCKPDVECQKVEAIKDHIVDKCRNSGKDLSQGFYVSDALDLTKKQYNIQYMEVKEGGAREALGGNRYVVAWYVITQAQHETMLSFFRRQPKAILTRSDINQSLRPNGSSPQGPGKDKAFSHVAILDECHGANSPKSLHIKNSWGSGYFDNGYFSIEDASVLRSDLLGYDMKFYDITPASKARVGP